MSRRYSVITGTGSYIPTKIVKNECFLSSVFLEPNGEKINKTNEEIVEKFREITTIEERRYIPDKLNAADMGVLAAEAAVLSAEIEKEELDYVIVAHNFGDVQTGNNRIETLPSLAAKIKHKLGIQNPETVAYDLIFGCPGWVQAVIQADYYIRSGDAKKILVIGADILSRLSDPHDRDSMIYADGAGAVVLEARESNVPVGILSHKSRSDTFLYSDMLRMGKSNHPDHSDSSDLFIKMNGRKLYQYALETVPPAIKACLEKCNQPLEHVKKVLIHQANGKMDEAILKRLYALYGIRNVPEDVMPMTISWLGNSSVATVPTLYDLIRKGQLEGHTIQNGDLLVFASVGAGMSVNTFVYKQ